MSRKGPPQSKTYKMFLNNLNSWTSNFIIEHFRTDHIPEARTKYEFIGLMNNSTHDLPKYLKPEIVEIEYNYSYKNPLFLSDVFIYNLNEGDPKELEYIVNGLNKVKFETERVLIIISSIMTWAGTPAKNCIRHVPTMPREIDVSSNKELITIKEQEKEEHEQPNPDDSNADNQKSEPEEKEEVIDEALYFIDEEYIQRRPHKNYFLYNLIENKALEMKNPNVKVYVVCPGFLYGKGEQIFSDYFKMSWLNEPISIVGTGKNIIPTLHIKDLVTLIKRIIDKKPIQRYILALDQTKNKTLKGILTAISKAMGNGSVNILDSFNIDTVNVPNYEEMSVNVLIKPSQIFFDERRENEDKEDYEKRSFKWSSQFGIEENQEKIRDEFLEYKGITQTKVIVLGMPYSGKSFISNRLGKIFNLPVLRIGDIIQWGKEQLEDDLGIEVRAKVEEIASKLQGEEELYNKRLNKKKTDLPFDSHQASKLPIDLVIKIIHSFIKNSPQCYSHGYLIDGFPRNYHEAELLHCHPETKEIIPETLPDNIILIDNCAEEFVVNRMKEKKEYTENPSIQERMTKRLLRYKDEHDKEVDPNTIEKLYAGNNVNVLKINIGQMSIDNTYNPHEVITTCNDFLLNHSDYISNSQHLQFTIPEVDDVELIFKEEEVNEEQKEENSKVADEDIPKEKPVQNIQIEKGKKHKKKKKHSNDSMEKKEDTLLDMKEPDLSHLLTESERDKEKEIEVTKPIDKQEEQREKDIQLLEKKSEVLRRYLAENVIPILSKGILQVSKEMPEDPVEALANFLLESTFEKSIGHKDNQDNDIQKHIAFEDDNNDNQIFIHEADLRFES